MGGVKLILRLQALKCVGKPIIKRRALQLFSCDGGGGERRIKTMRQSGLEEDMETGRTACVWKII